MPQKGVQWRPRRPQEGCREAPVLLNELNGLADGFVPSLYRRMCTLLVWLQVLGSGVAQQRSEFLEHLKSTCDIAKHSSA